MPKVVRVAISGAFGVRLPWLEQGEPPKFLKREEYVVTEHDLALLRFLKQQSSLYDLIRPHIEPRALKLVRRASGVSTKR